MENLKLKKIAILGCSGHIARALLFWMHQNENFYFYLFSRSLERTEDLIKKIVNKERIEIRGYSDFFDGKYDLILNCIGIGDPAKLLYNKFEIFRITEFYDNLIINYLQYNPATLYINFSSGAVYGKDFSIPACEQSIFAIKINNIEENDYYGISKIYSEIKHRALAEKNIVDLRIFGFFSRFIDLKAKYLMNDVIRCIIKNEILETNSENIVRDYINPKDLANLIMICIERPKLNDAFDVFSRKPISKFEILENFKQAFGLKYKINDNLSFDQATGKKINYYTKNYKAESIGFTPCYTSLETLIEETKFILEIKGELDKN